MAKERCIVQKTQATLARRTEQASEKNQRIRMDTIESMFQEFGGQIHTCKEFTKSDVGTRQILNSVGGYLFHPEALRGFNQLRAVTLKQAFDSLHKGLEPIEEFIEERNYLIQYRTNKRPMDVWVSPPI